MSIKPEVRMAIAALYRFEPVLHIVWPASIEEFWEAAVMADCRWLFYIQQLSCTQRRGAYQVAVQYRNTEIPLNRVYRVSCEQVLTQILQREVAAWSESFGVVLQQDTLPLSGVVNAFLKQNSLPQLERISHAGNRTQLGMRVERITLGYRASRRLLMDLHGQAEAAARELSRKIFLPGMPMAAKCLAAHQYLAASVRYKLPMNDDPLEWYRRHSACGALLDGTAVCQGYAHAYQMLMKYAGVDCLAVHGNTDRTGHGAHAWNLVRVPGEGYFHVDVTWDQDVKKPDLTYYMCNDAFLEEGRAWERDLYPASEGVCETLRPAAQWLRAHAGELESRGFPAKAIPDLSDPRFQ